LFVSSYGDAGNIQGTFREHSENIQGTFRKRSWIIQGTFIDHSGNIQGTCLEAVFDEVLIRACGIL
jgi:hypothetical protein